MSASIDDPGQAKRREELSRFLRDRRARVRPEAVGLPVGRRRRAPGLLREEVAQIAGVSSTWYTWLEQARATKPSARVLDGLAKALCLNPTERRHLYRLARPDLVPNAASTERETLPAPLHALLNGLMPHPAYVIDARWDVIAWNASAAIVFGGFEHLGPGERNILHRLLLDPDWRQLFVDWEAIVESSIAQFRAATVHLAADPGVTELVASLAKRSERFARLWRRQDVAHSRATQKKLRHRSGHVLTFNYATFSPDGADRDVRFTIYTPADRESSEALQAVLDPAGHGLAAI